MVSKKLYLFTHIGLLTIVGTLALFLLFRKDTQIIKVPTKRVLEKRIEKLQQLRPQYYIQNNTDKKLITNLDAQLKSLQEELGLLKLKRDTFQIISTQDDIINILSSQGRLKDSVIFRLEVLDSANQAVIANQDTLLRINKVDIKRVKRQRNIAVVTSALLGTLLILK